MTKGLYFKLAAENIKKNAKTYVPFMITCIITIAMFYIISSLAHNPGIMEMRGANFISSFMMIGTVVIAVFSFVFLFYTNSFLLKRRKKEFGLYNILGMEKRHISTVVFLEIVYTAAISLVLGLLGGILLDKLMYLIIANLLDVEITLGFYVSGGSVIASLILFGVIFFLIFLNSLRQIHFSKPIELLRGEAKGEKEPKTRWFMAILGLICLGLGYYISVTIEDTASAFALFFIAVFLVIAGTYLLFTAGSVFLLKALRKNKRYYYKTKHFISVSGMIYRMKQNAVGLANICILSTMVLVMISSTSCLMAGMNDIINTGCPYDLTLQMRKPYYHDEGDDESVSLERQKAFEDAINIVAEYEKEVTETNVFDLMEIICYFRDNKAELSGDITSSIADIFFITAEDYNNAFDKSLDLAPGEIAVAPYASDSKNFSYDSLVLFGREFKVKEKLDYFYVTANQNSAVADIGVIVMRDADDLYYISESYRTFNGILGSGSLCRRVFNANLSADEKRQFNEIYPDIYERTSNYVSVTSRANDKYDFLDLYGGLFFLGLFLGTLFIMAAVLIIYYKQISEGYDDKKRFEIMQNVGLSKSEVRSSIHSQVLTVFFLPLIAAGVHMSVAVPILLKLLAGLNMKNTELFLFCVIGCFIIFAVFYVIVYLLTARSYYKIVSRDMGKAGR